MGKRNSDCRKMEREETRKTTGDHFRERPMGNHYVSIAQSVRRKIMARKIKGVQHFAHPFLKKILHLSHPLP